MFILTVPNFGYNANITACLHLSDGIGILLFIQIEVFKNDHFLNNFYTYEEIIICGLTRQLIACLSLQISEFASRSKIPSS